MADPSPSRAQAVARTLLAVLFFVAGVLHLMIPAPFIRITPDWVPWPHLVIALTGVAELAGSIGLMIPPLRKAAAIGLALYTLCVWPANFHHAWMDLSKGTGLPIWYHLPRLALQPVIIWWALWAGEVTGWPFRRRN